MITAYTDGGARGNPGPAGYGVHVLDDQGNTLAELVGPLGHATNNVAEYSGLIAALQWALDNGERSLRVRMDSELVIKQMRGQYKVKHAGLQPLHAAAQRLVSQLGRVTFEHVRREQNKVADALSNKAMDLAEGKTPVAEAAPVNVPVGASAGSSVRRDTPRDEPFAPRTISIPRPARSAAAKSNPSPRFDFDID